MGERSAKLLKTTGKGGFVSDMLALIQRVSWACVEVDGEVVGKIDRGLLILLGAKEGDDSSQGEYLAGKVAELRIFNDDEGKMNRSLLEVGGAALWSRNSPCTPTSARGVVPASSPPLDRRWLNSYIKSS